MPDYMRDYVPDGVNGLCTCHKVGFTPKLRFDITNCLFTSTSTEKHFFDGFRFVRDNGVCDLSYFGCVI